MKNTDTPTNMTKTANLPRLFIKAETVLTEVRAVDLLQSPKRVATANGMYYGKTVILATNPLFPSTATEHRIRWAGLDPKDFLLYTTYDNSRHCKPNPAYYTDILEQAGLKPEDCLMVGNDVAEDMVAAGSLGIRGFLLTDCLINKKNLDISGYPQGSFDELKEFLGLK